jgi:hypothetical protein
VNADLANQPVLEASEKIKAAVKDIYRALLAKAEVASLN